MTRNVAASQTRLRAIKMCAGHEPAVSSDLKIARECGAEDSGLFHCDVVNSSFVPVCLSVGS